MPIAFTTTREFTTLSLQAWEIIGAERELKGVLSAVSDWLRPVLAFDGVGIVVFARETQRRLYALNLVHGSSPACTRNEVPPSRIHAPYDEAIQERMKSVLPYVCADLLAKESWYSHEFRLAAAGIRSYVPVPLSIHGEGMGVAVFGRRSPLAFTDDQIEVLRGISRAFAVAVSNALAYEEIRKLRDQLAEENIALQGSTEADAVVGRHYRKLRGAAPRA